MVVLVASCTLALAAGALALASGRRAVRTGELVEVTQEFQLSSPVRSVTVLEDRWAEPVEAWVRGLALRRRVVEPVPWWAWRGVLPTRAWRVRWVYQNFLPPADAPVAYTIPSRQLTVADGPTAKQAVVTPAVPLWVLPSREADDFTLAPNWKPEPASFSGWAGLALLLVSFGWMSWTIYERRRPRWVFASLRKDLRRLARKTKDVRQGLVCTYRALTRYTGTAPLTCEDVTRARPILQEAGRDLERFFFACEQAFYMPHPSANLCVSFRELEHLARKLARLERKGRRRP